jgi:hypothetical protein
MALSWDDVDMVDNIIRVRRSLQRLDGTLQLVETKTRSSTATLAVPPV